MKSKRKSKRKIKKKNSTYLNIVIVILAGVLAMLLQKSGLITRYDGVSVHYIDVGQADCVLIQSPSGNVVIDGGENATEAAVIEYIKNAGIETIDYVVATHPHSDHIGGLDGIILSFDVKAVIMPDVINTTTSYEKLIKAIADKGIKPIVPIAGSKFSVGEMDFTVLAPNSDEYDNLNNYSVVLKMEHGNTAFLFSADAELQSENEILAGSFDLSADVYKVGHHGSRTSSSSAFLDAVSPRFSVISCGKDNDYNHPHQEVMERLTKRNTQILRTDLLGTIVIRSDKESLTVK